jgi:hypothetical protein
MNNRQALAKVIKAVAVYYGRQLEPEVLSLMVDDLEDLPVDEVTAAYGRYRKNPKNRFFPLPSQIRELVAPEEFVEIEVQAREIAARVVGAVTSHGWCNAKAAELYIGPIGWQTVLRQGGWMHICQNLGVTINPTTFQAQLRDQIEGTLRYGTPAIERSIRALPAHESRGSDGMQSIGEILKIGTIVQQPEPDDAA